jgi:hypothetical protein
MFWKLVLLVLAIAAAWYGFKLLKRLDGRPKGRLKEKKRQPGEAIERMDQCRVCGTYVVAGQAANCGRPGCPY